MNRFKYIFLIVASMLWVSCERDIENSVADLLSKPEIESTFLSSYQATQTNLPQTFETVIFKKPNYGGNFPVESVVEIAVSGTNFAQPITIGSPSSSNNIKLTYTQINSALLLAGLKAEPKSIDLRIKSYLINTGKTPATDAVYSKVVSFDFTPFISGPIYGYTDLYLIGSATAGAWDNTANNNNMYPLLKVEGSATSYSYTGYFKGGADSGFKIVQEKGSWDPQYGFASEGKLSTSGGSGNIPVATSGYYKLTMDTSALTYTFEKLANPTTSYTTVGIIGTATANGWDASTPMVRSTHDPHIWTLMGVSLADGEMKFRANNSWDVNWGAKGEFFGTATRGGDNIKIKTAWKYNIYFNDVTGDYTIIPAE